MKKFLGLIVMAMVMVVPFGVKAATSLIPKCEDLEDNLVSCVISGNATEAISSMTITVTEEGGAEIKGIVEASNSDWTFAKDPEYSNGVWTISLSAPSVTGNFDLFEITYLKSGSEDCRIVLDLNGVKKPVTPPSTPDKPEENKKTGATLPYIALGAIAIVAVGTYAATRNKTKMYKI